MASVWGIIMLCLYNMGIILRVLFSTRIQFDSINTSILSSRDFVVPTDLQLLRKVDQIRVLATLEKLIRENDYQMIAARGHEL